MQVERAKYVIWAADMERALRFWRETFGARVVHSSEIMAELEIVGATIAIHNGGEGKRTWTGISLQVADVVAGAAEIASQGGGIVREPREENGEVPHLAMCFDTEGNEFMLTRKR